MLSQARRSRLTESTSFNGSLLDMRLARQAVDTLPDRPDMLRKHFVLDKGSSSKEFNQEYTLLYLTQRHGARGRFFSSFFFFLRSLPIDSS